jgi:hypothetical protein
MENASDDAVVSVDATRIGEMQQALQSPHKEESELQLADIRQSPGQSTSVTTGNITTDEIVHDQNTTTATTATVDTATATATSEATNDFDDDELFAAVDNHVNEQNQIANHNHDRSHNQVDSSKYQDGDIDKEKDSARCLSTVSPVATTLPAATMTPVTPVTSTLPVATVTPVPTTMKETRSAVLPKLASAVAITPQKAPRLQSQAEKRTNGKINEERRRRQSERLRLPSLEGKQQKKNKQQRVLASKDDSYGHDEDEVDDGSHLHQSPSKGDILVLPKSSPMNQSRNQKHKKPLYLRMMERARKQLFLEEQEKVLLIFFPLLTLVELHAWFHLFVDISKVTRVTDVVH